MAEISLEGFAGVAVAPPSEGDFNRVAERQQREMGGRADQIFSQQNLGEAARRLQQKFAETRALMERVGVRPWSVVNLMPFPLNVNGVLHSRMAGLDGNQVPECPVGAPYVQKVIRDVQYSIKDEGAGMDNVDNYTPVPWDPSILAQDYGIQFLDKMSVGGVILYEGDHPPTTPGLQKALRDAREARNRYLLRKVHEAENEWADTSGVRRKNITDIHRKAAEVLLHDKVLKQQPAWLLAVNDPQGERPEPCAGCGDVADARAAICKGCGYVYKPVEAYKAALIEYGHISMDRLSAEEWKTVNEIKAQRDKARAAGKVERKEAK
jgi:hypothetical protein